MGGHGAWWDDQEAQGAGGGASPALPRHRRRHGQDQELARDGGVHPQGDVERPPRHRWGQRHKQELG